jgi:hypothetical protein
MLEATLLYFSPVEKFWDYVTRLIYPQAVGGDIGCGMLAVRLDVDATPLRDLVRLPAGQSTS